jgi:hypothetical protein
VGAQLEARELVHQAVHRLAHLGEADELPNLLAVQVVPAVPRQVLALNLRGAGGRGGGQAGRWVGGQWGRSRVCGERLTGGW